MVDLIGLAGSDAFSIVVACCLLASGMTVAVIASLRSRAHIQQVRQATAAVVTDDDADEFARDLDAISAQMEALPLLHAAWLRFTSQLFSRGDDADGKKGLLCTTAPARHFNVAAVRNVGRDYRALPGLILSLSVLLTVISVAASMSTAMRVVEDRSLSAASGQTAPAPLLANASADTTAGAAQAALLATMRNAFREMLKAGRASFAIVIAGLFVSLLLTITLRICGSRLKAALSRFAAALQQRVVVVSFEAIVLERLAIGSVASGHTDGASGSEIQRALEQALPMHLDLNAAKIQVAIEQHTSASIDATSTAITKLAEELGRAIDQGVGQPIQSMTTQLQEEMLRVRGHLVGVANLLTAAAANRSRAAVMEPDAASQTQPPLAQARANEPGHLEATGLHDSLIGEMQSLLVALRQSNADAASVNRLANEKLLSELVERVEAGIARSVRELSGPLVDMRASLQQAAIASLRSADASDTAAGGGHAETARIQADVAALRQSVEAGNLFVAAENRAAIAALAKDLDQRATGAGQLDPGVIAAIDDVRVKLVRIETALSSADRAALQPGKLGSVAPLQEFVSQVRAAITDSQGRIVRENQGAANALAEFVDKRLETAIAAPMQGLASTVAEMERKLSASVLDIARDRAAGKPDGPADSAKEIRDAIAALSMHARDEDLAGTKRRALLDQVAGAAAELSQAGGKLERDGSAIIARLDQAIAAAPANLSREADAAALALRSAIETLDGLAEGFVQRLEARMALTVHDQVASSIDGLQIGARAATDEMRGAIVAVTSHAKADIEIARRELADALRENIAVLGQEARQIDQSGSQLASRLEQILEGAQSSRTQEAAVAARTIDESIEAARARLEQTVSSMTAASTQEMQQTTAAFAKIAEQFVRQSSLERDIVNAQLAASVGGIEQASSTVTQAIDSLRASLSTGGSTETTAILEQLVTANLALRATTQKSNEDAVHSVEAIWRATNEAHTMMAADLEQLRHRLFKQAEELNRSAVDKLQQTADNIAASMAGYGGNLTATVDGLVLTLQALSHEMRHLKASMDESGARTVLAADRPLAIATNAAALPDNEFIDRLPAVALGVRRTRI